MLEVNLLGRFEVLRTGRRLNIPTRNAQTLFAYLILNAGKSFRRERLAGLLWPDSSEDNARSNLRHELWRLRKALEADGESYFIIDDLEIGFNPESDYSLDVRQLEGVPVETSQTGDLIAALSAYQGELLPGFYEEWVFPERERLYTLFEAKSTRLLEILQAEGNWSEALNWGMRWIAFGQWPEPAYRALMAAYANSGDISKALTTYERLAQGLQKDLGVKPSEQTQSLYKRIKAGWKPDATEKAAIQEKQPALAPLEKAAPSTPLTKAHRSNLPRPLTSFIGREKEIQQVERLVTGARLVTIVGSGGVGKTRLAIQVAATLERQFTDGACWVELAALSAGANARKRELESQTGKPVEATGGDLVAQEVAKALRVPESPDLPLIEGVLAHLHEKKLLLTLDNCEHLIEATACLVERVLGDCPEVTILATSREALGVPGEKAWLLPSLSLPEEKSPSDLKRIFQSEAVNLFIERSGDILPGYQPGYLDALTIAQICLQLDGIPLAIELAAARMNLLSVQEIAARLDRRFSLLTDGSRTALPRHQTLLAAIEWSYDLLDEPERILFRRLSIFAGSFTLEAVEAICANREILSDEMLTLLGRLADKSLVKVAPTPHDPDLATRYRLLDTIQSFGRLKMDDAGETGWMRDRRTDYYVRLVETAEPELLGPHQLVCLKRLQEEHTNLQAVLQWLLEAQEAESLLRLVGSLWRFWWMRSQHNEGREWLEKALALPGPQPPRLRAKALTGAGILARGQGDFDKASVFLHESLEIFTSLDDKDGIATVQNVLGLLTHTQGDTAKANHHYQESLKYRRETGDKRGIAVALHNLSMIRQEQGELAQAEALLNESLALFQEIDDTRNIAATQVRLGYVMYELERAEQSDDYFRKSLFTMKDLGQRNDIIECLEGFAGVAALHQDPQRGARLLAAAQAQREVIGIPVSRYQQPLYQRIVESVTNQLDTQALEQYRAEGRRMSLEEAVEYALKGADKKRQVIIEPG